MQPKRITDLAVLVLSSKRPLRLPGSQIWWRGDKRIFQLPFKQYTIENVGLPIFWDWKLGHWSHVQMGHICVILSYHWLVQIITFRLFGTKPLSGLMLTHCQFHTCWHESVMQVRFHSRKRSVFCRLQMCVDVIWCHSHYIKCPTVQKYLTKTSIWRCIYTLL